MINLPQFESLVVDGYALYPGQGTDTGLHASFAPGTTLVMGANGLGKSTLVLMLYRLCTGPTELSAGVGSSELGYSQLTQVNLGWQESRTFAARVNDRALHASATLRIRLGDDIIELTRSLNTLHLTGFSVNGLPSEPNETAFQAEITRSAGLERFVDWLLIQRYLIFYGDDRKSLVWDRTAQRQLLRLLFLPPNESGRWLELEQDFLRQSTQYRNYRAILSREAAALAKEEAKLAKVPNVTEEINGLIAEADELEAQRVHAATTVDESHAMIRSLELGVLRASENRETAYRSLEHARLFEIQAAFPDASATAAYLVGQIITGSICVVCGTEVPEFASELIGRVHSNRCVICGSDTSASSEDNSTADFDTLEIELKEAEVALDQLVKDREALNEEYAASLKLLRDLEQKLGTIEGRLAALSANLPDADRKVRDRQTSLASMQANADEMRSQLNRVQLAYQEYVSNQQRQIGTRKDDVKAAFARFAREFLVEDCELVWDSYLAPIGQINEPTQFYVFEIDMTGGASSSATRRERAQDVSESQREFIDLAFRMALISVAGSDGQGSLVIDTPESSLDAVFAPRAARVLAEFGVEAPGNRLIVTSNLVDGDLIPTLLELAGIESRSDSRVIDLIAIAEPTAAVREWRAAYDEAVQKVFDRATQR